MGTWDIVGMVEIYQGGIAFRIMVPIKLFIISFIVMLFP